MFTYMQRIPGRWAWGDAVRPALQQIRTRGEAANSAYPENSAQLFVPMLGRQSLNLRDFGHKQRHMDTATGPPTWTATPWGMALEFNGTDASLWQGAAAGNGDGNNRWAQYSFEMFFIPTEEIASNLFTIVDTQGSTTTNAAIFWKNSDETVTWRVFTTAGQLLSSTSLTWLHHPTHIVGTWSGDNPMLGGDHGRLWFNGGLEASTTTGGDAWTLGSTPGLEIAHGYDGTSDDTYGAFRLLYLILYPYIVGNAEARQMYETRFSRWEPEHYARTGRSVVAAASGAAPKAYYYRRRRTG